MAACWYVLRSKPRKEMALSQYAASQGHRVYFPCLPANPVNPRAAKSRPYFPGYLFVHADLQVVGESTFHWMPLSQGLVRVGGEPAPVPEGVIQALKQQMHRLRQHGFEEAGRFKRGDPVLVCAGAFEGYEGIFDMSLSGGERARVLLRMIYDRYLPVEIEAGCLKVHQPSLAG